MSKYLPEFLSTDREIISVFPLHYRQMVADKAKPPEVLLDNFRPHPVEIHQLHMSYALLGEVIELETALEILITNNDPVYGADVIKELGDCMFYICGATGGKVVVGSGLLDDDFFLTSMTYVMQLWPAGLPVPAGCICDASWQQQLKMLRWVSAQWHDAYKRILIYRTGDTQIKEVTADEAAKRQRLEQVVNHASVVLVVLLAEIGRLVDQKMTIDEILVTNEIKLGVRYVGRYSDDAAHQRADVEEGKDDCSASAGTAGVDFAVGKDKNIPFRGIAPESPTQGEDLPPHP